MKKLLYFTAGAVIGSLVTWKIVKDKYEQLANDEIESVKSALSKKKNKHDDLNKLDDAEVVSKANENLDIKNERVKYHDIIKNRGYTNEYEESKENDIPYIIEEEEFGIFEEYETITLNYFSDGVLTDDLDEPVDNPEEIVSNIYRTFDIDLSKNVLYVRNDSRKCDYEILRNTEKYSDLY